jgi:GrpB-like predicted nucleotidyltransferase (UPF0157 family)
MRILPYFSTPTQFLAYDPSLTEIVCLLVDALRNAEPQLKIEHVGSTSVPGCGGKGIIDLAVLYPTGFLEKAKSVLNDIGFQKQMGQEVFSEERPMRVGSIDYNGRLVRIHAHVIALDSAEHEELIWFREMLRRDPLLRYKYENEKRAILAQGIQDSVEYSKAKGEFLANLLQRRNGARIST